MNKTTLILLLIFTWIMTACGSSASDSADPASAPQNGPTAGGELSSAVQVALGTIKLDGSDNAVTTEQATQLLPLWQTLQVLYSSDTAADEEIDALITQLHETMTDEQTRSITALNLTRQDMLSIMQEQGMDLGAQYRNTQSGETSNNNGSGFGPGGGGLGGPPPDGGMPGGNPDFQGQGSRPQFTNPTGDTALMAINPTDVPLPLVQAVIEYLKKKIGS